MVPTSRRMSADVNHFDLWLHYFFLLFGPFHHTTTYTKCLCRSFMFSIGHHMNDADPMKSPMQMKYMFNSLVQRMQKDTSTRRTLCIDAGKSPARCHWSHNISHHQVAQADCHLIDHTIWWSHQQVDDLVISSCHHFFRFLVHQPLSLLVWAIRMWYCSVLVRISRQPTIHSSWN